MPLIPRRLTLSVTLLALVAALAAACGSSTINPNGGDSGALLNDDAGGQPGMDAGGNGADSGAPQQDAAALHQDAAVHNDSSVPPGGGITIIVEPSDSGTALYNAIHNAHTSIHVTMYLLTNTDIIASLVAHKQAGHEVKVVLNQTFPSGTGTTNQGAFTTLQSAGVAVHWAPATFTYTHEKCVIIDGTTAWIMTMNATQSSATDNREYLAVDTIPADVAEAEAIFQADFNSTTGTFTGDLLVAPINARTRIVALINTATTTVDMEAEELSDTQVVNALASAADRGARVRIVLASGTPSSSQATAIATLKTHGVSLVTLTSPYIHAKSVVVNSASAYVGSENFSTGSLQYNRELGVIFSTATEVQKVVTATATDFSHGTAL